MSESTAMLYEPLPMKYEVLQACRGVEFDRHPILRSAHARVDRLAQFTAAASAALANSTDRHLGDAWERPAEPAVGYEGPVTGVQSDRRRLPGGTCGARRRFRPGDERIARSDRSGGEWNQLQRCNRRFVSVASAACRKGPKLTRATPSSAK